jgi:periplasmic protein CpxP/Spy
MGLIAVTKKNKKMRKAALAIVLIVGLTFSGTAQENQSKKRGATESMSMEQRNELHLKKMTLDLDLTVSQQKEIASLLSEKSKEREAKMTERKANKDAKKQLTPDEKFAMKSKMLDEKIEMKAQMKKILNEKQMEKWESNQDKKDRKRQVIKRNHNQKPNKQVSE